MATPKNSFDIPYREPVVNRSFLLTRAWEWFFRSVYTRLYALGIERSFALANNISTPTDIIGARFDKRGVTQAVVEYMIQRVTTGVGAIEKIESGILIFVYRPTSLDWDIVVVSEETPDDAGINFSITADGQVQYTSTNETGTPLISNLFWRARTLGGKNQLYSDMGAR